MALTKPCKFCNAEIVMDNKDGRWLPYNVNGSPHKCQTEQQAGNINLRSDPRPDVSSTIATQQKNDHGNEETGGVYFNDKKITPNIKVADLNAGEYVDHTIVGIAQIKSFSAPSNEILDKDANEWLLSRGNTIRFRGGQFQMTEKGCGVALWYEETKQ